MLKGTYNSFKYFALKLCWITFEIFLFSFLQKLWQFYFKNLQYSSFHCSYSPKSLFQKLLQIIMINVIAQRRGDEVLIKIFILRSVTINWILHFRKMVSRISLMRCIHLLVLDYSLNTIFDEKLLLDKTCYYSFRYSYSASK